MKKTLPSHLGCYLEKFSQPNKTICPIHFSKMNHSNLKQTKALPFGCFWDAMLLQFLFGMSLSAEVVWNWMWHMLKFFIIKSNLDKFKKLMVPNGFTFFFYLWSNHLVPCWFSRVYTTWSTFGDSILLWISNRPRLGVFRNATVWNPINRKKLCWCKIGWFPPKQRTVFCCFPTTKLLSFCMNCCFTSFKASKKISNKFLESTQWIGSHGWNSLCPNYPLNSVPKVCTFRKIFECCWCTSMK